jgi:hypothetical protein
MRLDLLNGQLHFSPASTSTPPVWGFGSSRAGKNIRMFFLPYWFPFLLGATLAAAPWIKWRFSLRTLLIATTLVAFLLGLICYAAR